MKKYLISIESANSDRLNKLYSQATFYNYKDEFKQFGIIGKNLSVSEYFQQGVAGKKKPMTPGELGCTLSHIAALRDFLNSDEQYAIIFEDDVIERFDIDLDDLENLIKDMKLKPNFFLSLGGIQMKICNKVRGKLLPNVFFGEKILKVDLDFLDKLAYAYAYVVDRGMAKRLISYHATPKIYDHWGGLLLEKNISFYATFLFEHPVLNEDNLDNCSYLEQERLLMGQVKKNRIYYFHYYLKKIKKIVLNKWS
ncbi:glycosyltransferase family 25 protein [Acinetobacter sp. ANC 4633]|uniref:glycosyltransferase family 25 protein n=1 Tax=Acinetobacter sp. ANC 4633 TaxID=2529845 RepID=UPI00103A7CD2|nr:glycosyltransferase family 25 protein [Acinetobacter sp. ANC 4633]TCB26336.1 glycosyltransferase family 25 protein [Acinetobacter sp. ANC 4633]